MRLTRTGERWLFATYVVAAVFFTLPALLSGSRLGIEDWDVLLFYHASVLRSVFDYGRLPFWNPWYCGGNVLWQNPQVALLSPVYPLALVASLPFAMKLAIALHYAIGLIGMHVLLTRGLRLTFWPGIVFLNASVIFAGGPVFHLMVGHATYLPYFYLPWALFLAIRAFDSGRLAYGVGAGAVLAVCIYNGGFQVAFMFSVGLGVLGALLSAFRRDWRPIATVVLVGLFTVLLSAPKLAPTRAFVSSPRTVDTRYVPPVPDTISLEMLEHAFLDPFQFDHLRFGDQPYGWHEYATYVGSFSALVLVVTIGWLLGRPFWRPALALEGALAVTAIVLFLIALGEFAPYAPYQLLRRLPVTSQFRIASRYLLIFLLFAAAAVAAAWRTLTSEPSARTARYAGALLTAAALMLMAWNRSHFADAFPFEPLGPVFHVLSRPPAPSIDVVTAGLDAGRSPTLHALEANRDVLMCYEPLRLSGDVQVDKPIVFGDAGVRVSDVAFSPDRVVFRVVAGRSSGRVFLNQRYADGWRSDAGPIKIDPKGLGYVDLAPGQAGRYSFSFIPPGLFAGIGGLLVGIALAIPIARRKW